MATANDVLSRAAKEIGYSRWTDPKQGTIYGRWYADLMNSPYFGTNGVPYCAMFVSYILAAVKQTCPGFPSAGCTTAMRVARSKGAVLSNKKDARPGDIVLFDWDGSGDADHVGFVELNKGSYIQTIEGNTSSGSSGSQSNGGGVYRRTRFWSTVIAVIRPPYSGAVATPSKPSNTGTVAPASKLKIDGWIGSTSMKAWQRQLNCAIVDGFISGQYSGNKKYLPNITAIEWGDGGSTFVINLQKFLKRKGYSVSVDGYFGPNTVLALQKWMTDYLGYRKHGHDSIFGINTAANVQNAINSGAFKS